MAVKNFTVFSSFPLLKVGLQSLNLGICPKLSNLTIEAPKMVVLELKGCGVLSKASISCPLLTSLDASFCRLYIYIFVFNHFLFYLIVEIFQVWYPTYR